ncbi:hypothetical protein BH09BAC2_BH09BAC2_00460 [soil metagenome]
MSKYTLQGLRNLTNLSQTDFAKKVGVSQGMISDIERGKIPISTKIKTKIIENIGFKSGVLKGVDVSKYLEVNQGSDSGSNQGNDGKIRFLSPDGRMLEYEFEKHDRIEAGRLSFNEIVQILTDRAGEVILLNIPDEMNKRLSQLYDKQRFVTEKAIEALCTERNNFKEFKDNLQAIITFQNVLENIINCTEITDIFTARGAARHSLTMNLPETKAAIASNFKVIEPFAPIFKSLAQSMKTFADKARTIPQSITGIDKGEFDNYIELNS